MWARNARWKKKKHRRENQPNEIDFAGRQESEK
nr:MAG TPA: hypothetical protein [Caudoviricetes sp.]